MGLISMEPGSMGTRIAFRREESGVPPRPACLLVACPSMGMSAVNHLVRSCNRVCAVNPTSRPPRWLNCWARSGARNQRRACRRYTLGPVIRMKSGPRVLALRSSAPCWLLCRLSPRIVFRPTPRIIQASRVGYEKSESWLSQDTPRTRCVPGCKKEK